MGRCLLNSGIVSMVVVSGCSVLSSVIMFVFNFCVMV